ncbi:MAG: glycosyltransferase, partial [Pseudomonadota bacterium]
KRDLQKIIAEFDLPMPEIRVTILGLCLDETIKPTYPRALPKALDEGFVLSVGTLEPRKNYGMLYEIWRALYQRHADIYKPLVIVGNTGWRSETLENQLSNNYLLHKNPIIRLSKVDDAELTWLYQNCRLTIYPSFYEGWGLPVSESLLHGKYCITSNTSSLPEAGLGCCSHFDPIDGEGFLKEIVKSLSDDTYLQSREQKIAASVTSRSWQDSGREFFAGIAGL